MSKLFTAKLLVSFVCVLKLISLFLDELLISRLRIFSDFKPFLLPLFIFNSLYEFLCSNWVRFDFKTRGDMKTLSFLTLLYYFLPVVCAFWLVSGSSFFITLWSIWNWPICTSDTSFWVYSMRSVTWFTKTGYLSLYSLTLHGSLFSQSDSLETTKA